MSSTITNQITERPITIRYALGALLTLGVALYAYTLVRTAWLCDDAYITFRTIDNFIHGYGLTWNTCERVQAYTHPLWMLLLSGFYWFTREIYFTSLLVSMAISLTAVMVFATKIARSRPQAILGLTILIFSKAFMDYSTSGLENPLTYLLLALFFGVYLPDRSMTGRRLLVLSLLGSLAMVNRMDTILLLGPALLAAWWRGRRTAGTPAKDSGLAPGNNHGPEPATATTAGSGPCHPPLLPFHLVTRSPCHLVSRCCRFTLSPGHLVTLSAVLGFLPFVAWEAFSVIYYGFPFPNTAYAKLNTGVPAGDLLRQGLYYLVNSAQMDPLTLVVIATALAAVILRPQRKQQLIAVGLALYLVYVVKIGGDFMSGRFLAAPLFCAAVIVCSLPVKFNPWMWLVALGLVGVIGLSGPFPPIKRKLDYGQDRRGMWDRHDIEDASGWFYPTTGLLTNWRNREPSHKWVDKGRGQRQANAQVVTVGPIGIWGYYAGPDCRLIDPFALADPLLARMPARLNTHWRIGHFYREIPNGYSETVAAGKNMLKDPQLAGFYDELCRIVQGPLFTRQRWAAIRDMNLGRYDHLIDREPYANPPAHFGLDELAEPKDDGTSLEAKGIFWFASRGFDVPLGRLRHEPCLEVSLDAERTYMVHYIRNGRVLDSEGTSVVHPRHPAPSGLAVYQVNVPQAVLRAGYDKVWIVPGSGAGRDYAVGHIRLLEKVAPSKKEASL